MIGLVHHAGIQRDHIGTGGLKAADIIDRDFAHTGNGVGASAQPGRQGDGVTHVQGVDLAEDAVYTSVVVE